MTDPTPSTARLTDEQKVTDALARLKLRFFRECNAGTRRHLFALFGLPVDEITNEGTEHG